MLAHHASHGEDAGPALLPGPSRPAHLGDRAGACVDRLGDLALADYGAVAEDHGRLQGTSR